jgi:PAS domain S-box-containing protein
MVSSALDALPRGGGLSEQAWWARHRAVLLLLWAHVPVIALLTSVPGAGLVQGLATTTTVAALAAGATWGRGRTFRTSMATVALLVASSGLVYITGGAVAAHLHFFVTMAVITLYQEWLPYLLAVALVVSHYVAFGVLNPEGVFDGSPGLGAPWAWALVHGGFLLATSAVGVIAWRLDEKAAEELRDVQHRFKDAFDNAPIGVAVVALDGRWLEINRALCRITGYSEEELLRKTFQDITHPDDLAGDLEQAQRLTEGEISGYELEKRYVRADGSFVPILLNVTLMRDKRGDPQYFIARVEDIEERRRSEAYQRRLYESQRALVRELEEAHRLKSELFNIVSHEFKTPLASIIGFAGLLANKEDQLSDESRHKYVDTIARQAERLNRLVENLFVSARQVEPSRESTGDVQEAMNAVQAQLSDSYDDVSFDLAIPSGLRLRMSQEALRLVLLNLASNAVKHAAPDTSVAVAAHREQGDVLVSVTNEGEPIPDSLRDRIFEPFVQSGEPSGRTADGVGLGLHIVGKLVDAHGGRVELREADGKVTFVIRVPEAVGLAGEAAPIDLTEAQASA